MKMNKTYTKIYYLCYNVKVNNSKEPSIIVIGGSFYENF